MCIICILVDILDVPVPLGMFPLFGVYVYL